MEYNADEDTKDIITDLEIEEPYTSNPVQKRKISFVWDYFRQIPGTSSFECIVCNACVGYQTSNLARHLATSHDITKNRENSNRRGRPTISFIWLFCNKVNKKQVRCHLCKKILYFGGGNTSNITKHLRRKHSEEYKKAFMDETSHAIANINPKDELNADAEDKGMSKSNGSASSKRKERKGGSYVWNYCDKISRHTIRCKLCSKVMSFHGTANVITHLQRKHNILGKVDKEKDKMINDTNMELDISNDNLTIEQLDESDSPPKRGRRESASGSVVWKYCKRIGKDVVRCGFCKKNLSYQGTSNLQRHLHRMHGIASNGRYFKDDSEQSPQHLDTNLIWEYCSELDLQKIKCNMCNTIFESHDLDEINKHLTISHSIKPPLRERRSKRRRHSETSSEEYEENEEIDESWNKYDELPTVPDDENSIKRDESIYDEFIEEEVTQTNTEDLFDPNVVQEIVIQNPLSPQSSGGASVEFEHKTPAISKRMQKLMEQRVRVETEYFREKAGYYRMQKYLTALQAKKVRYEMEQFNITQLNGTTYTVNDTIQQNIPIHLN